MQDAKTIGDDDACGPGRQSDGDGADRKPRLGTSSQKQMPWPAPVGHRQPRTDQVPPEKNLSNPNNPVNREDAALDRKIKSICRGC